MGGDLDGLPKGGLGSLKVAKGCKDKLKDPSAPPQFLQNDVPAWNFRNQKVTGAVGYKKEKPNIPQFCK